MKFMKFFAYRYLQKVLLSLLFNAVKQNRCAIFLLPVVRDRIAEKIHTCIYAYADVFMKLRA